MATLGKKLIVGQYSGSTYTPIAAAKSCEFTTECDSILTSSADNSDWDTYIAGRKKWKVTVSFLMINRSVLDSTNVNLDDVLQVGKTFHLALYVSGEYTYIKGTAILTTCKLTGTVGNLCQGSFQFVGTSALTSETDWP